VDPSGWIAKEVTAPPVPAQVQMVVKLVVQDDDDHIGQQLDGYDFRSG
jgi:hypothetical protein